MLWDSFNKRSHEIKNTLPEAAIGLCRTLEDAPEGVFEYVACFLVANVEDLPPEMDVRSVPEHTHAVFTQTGALTSLHKTYEYIYSTWLPASDYKLAANIDFEYYNEDFKDYVEDSRFDIYVPIQK